jgi:hypothetical protein
MAFTMSLWQPLQSSYPGRFVANGVAESALSWHWLQAPLFSGGWTVSCSSAG